MRIQFALARMRIECTLKNTSHANTAFQAPKALIRDLIKTAIIKSYTIWKLRNMHIPIKLTSNYSTIIHCVRPKIYMRYVFLYNINYRHFFSTKSSLPLFTYNYTIKSWKHKKRES